MQFLKQTWWWILPFILFFFDFKAITAFVGLLLVCAVYWYVPVNPRRGKLLTWLIVGQAAIIAMLAIAMGLAHQIYWHWLILIISEAACLVGIWEWKKVAAGCLLLLFAIHDAMSLIIAPSNYRLHPAPEVTGELILLLVFSVWLTLWIKAFKQKWSLFI